MTATSNTNEVTRHLYIVSYSSEGSALSEVVGYSTSRGDAQAFVIRQIEKERKQHATGSLYVSDNVMVNDNDEDIDYYAIADKYSGAIRHYDCSSEREGVDYLARFLTRKGCRVCVEGYRTEQVREFKF